MAIMKSINSVPLRFSYSFGSSNTTPILFFTSISFLSSGIPSISISPDVGFNVPVNILIVVVFPAPFGPRNPYISPFFISRLIELTATILPKTFFKFLALIINTFRVSEPLQLSQYFSLLAHSSGQYQAPF